MVGATAGGLETAASIRREAARLFAVHGYEATSLREIAASVGIKVGSLYNHISSKEELLLNVMGGIMDDLLAQLDEALSDVTDPVDRLIALMDCHIRFHAERAQETFIGNSELRSLPPEARTTITAKRAEYRGRIETLIREAHQTTESPLLNVRLHAFSVIAIGTHVSGWYRPDGGMSLAQITSTYTKIVLRSLAVVDADARVDAVLDTD